MIAHSCVIARLASWTAHARKGSIKDELAALLLQLLLDLLACNARHNMHALLQQQPGLSVCGTNCEPSWETK